MLPAKRPMTTGPYLSRREITAPLLLDDGVDSTSARAPTTVGSCVALGLELPECTVVAVEELTGERLEAEVVEGEVEFELVLLLELSGNKTSRSTGSTTKGDR